MPGTIYVKKEIQTLAQNCCLSSLLFIIIIYYAFIRSIQGHKPIGYRTCHWI